jgi:predicted alpha/beta hydrolase family esterase
MPTVPFKKHLLKFFSQKGFWVFHPRYRGTWESDGKFLARSPHHDILDVINGIHQNFRSIWNDNSKKNKPFKLQPEELILIGSSFGGPAVILASRDKRVSKVLAISPVINWAKPSKNEPLGFLAKFTEQAFGNGYRTVKNGWQKLASGKFYNPINHAAEIDGSKLLLVHAKDDGICSYMETKRFATKTAAKLITLPRGGHLGSSLLLKPRFYKAFQKFIKTATPKI